jgi:hypothetical protein
MDLTDYNQRLVDLARKWMNGVKSKLDNVPFYF